MHYLCGLDCMCRMCECVWKCVRVCVNRTEHHDDRTSWGGFVTDLSLRGRTRLASMSRDHVVCVCVCVCLCVCVWREMDGYVCGERWMDMCVYVYDVCRRVGERIADTAHTLCTTTNGNTRRKKCQSYCEWSLRLSGSPYQRAYTHV